MSYFRYIDNGEGPTKLFIGGLHGNEGKTSIKFIKRIYNLKNYDSLTSMERYEKTGIPPLIKLKNHVLVSSVSPLIRMTYFSTDTVCKTLEFPCVEKLTPEIVKQYDFDYEMAVKSYEDLLKLILKSPSREYFEKQMLIDYAPQVDLAVRYASKVFGKDFPPY